MPTPRHPIALIILSISKREVARAVDLFTAQSELGQRRVLDIVEAESIHLRPATLCSLRSTVCPETVTSLSFPRSANTAFGQSVMAITWAIEPTE